MNLKKYSILALVLGVVSLLVGALMPVIYKCMQNNDSVGVIGGAGAHSYRFLLNRMLNGLPVVLVALGPALIISAGFCLLFSNSVKANCSIKTSAISMALSAVGAIGLSAFLNWYIIVAFNEMSQHPIRYPASLALGTISLIVFIWLIFVYFTARNRTSSAKGIIIDVATTLIFLPTFLLGAASLMS